MTAESRTDSSTGEMRAAVLPLNFWLLEKLLQLPVGASIDAAWSDPMDDRTLMVRVIGAGWRAAHGCRLARARGTVTEYRDDDGRTFKTVITWDLPNANSASKDAKHSVE